MSGFFDPFGNSSGGGGTSSKDEVARAEIAAIKDGETLDSFGDVEAALADKADITDIPTIPITAIQKNGTDITPVSGTVNIVIPTQASDINAATATQGGKADTAIQGVKVNSSTVNPDSNKVVSITVPTTAADVLALPDTTKYAAALSLTINSSTYVMTGQLKDQNGDNLGTAQTIDLPLESVVVGGSYNSQTKKVVLTLQNGNTIEFSVADLVSGLQTELSASNKLNPAYINYDSTHRAVSDTEKSTWNGKQNALSSTQLDAVNSGIDSTKVAQIETNKNNISLKANTSDVNTATANLQAQINNIVTPVTQDAEVQNARVGADGTNYTTLKNRCDAEYTQLKNNISNIGTQSVNLFDISTITERKCYIGTIGQTIALSDNANYYCFQIDVKPNTDYTISQVSYTTYITDATGKVLRAKGNGSSSNYTFNTGNNAVKACISVNKNQCEASDLMAVEGATLPSSYIPYGFFFSATAEASIKKIAQTSAEVYHVGANKEYTSFTDCIRDLKNNANSKTIYVDAGIYDLYEEMGGEEFIRSIPDDETDWRNVCDIIPPNTTIIGVGYVEFKYDPVYYTQVSSRLISPINIGSGNVTLEHIRVTGRNCRYTIHDDGSGDNDSVSHIYRDVLCQKYGGGYTQAFGSGIGKNCSIEFYGCEIISNRVAFSVHNQWYAEFGRLIFENCVILGNTEDVRLASLSSRDTSYPISVTLRNCKVSTVKYTNEDGVSRRTIPYQVTVCNSGTPTFDDSAFDNNQFPPVIY